MAETTCPRCAKPVEPVWLICPHCEALLYGPERGSRGGLNKLARDRFIRLTGNKGIRLLSLLGASALCVVGAMMFVPLTLTFFSSTYTFTGIEVIGGVILLVGGFFVLVWLHRRPPQGFLSAGMTGAMALVGGLILFSLVAGVVFMIIAAALNC